MNFLTTHGEKLVCAVVVVLCGVWVYMSLGADTTQKEKEIKDAQVKIRSYLDSNTVQPTWSYHPDNAKAYSEQVKGYVESAERPLAPPPTAYAFYPRPARPVIEEKKEVKIEGVTEIAALPKFAGLGVTGEQGLVAVNCQRPTQMKRFAPVRVEVQRGTAPDKLDKTIHVFELGPETGAATGDAGKKEEEKVDEPVVERAGTTARTLRRGGGVLATGRPKVKTTPNALIFEDTTVQAKTTYYYRARLVSRLVTLGPNNVVFENGKEITIVVPDTVTKVPGKLEGTTLYASPWSDVAKASIPADFQLRFNFVTGKIPEDPRAKQLGYGVFFGVRLWDAEARAWSESSFEVPVGKAIGGKRKFKVKGTTKLREFDTGLKLVSVRPAIKFETVKVKEFLTEMKTDDNGDEVPVPVVDENGQPKWVEKLVARETATQVAILQVGDTEKQIRLVKGLGYGVELPETVKILLEGEPRPKLEQPKMDGAAAGKKEAPAKKTP